MSGAAGGAGLETILNGSAGLDWSDRSALILTVDQALRVVSSVFLAGDAPPRDIAAAGAPFLQLFPADPLQSIVAPHVAAVLTGEAREVDVAWDDPEALRMRLSFLPRFQGPGRQRGFFLTARNVAALEARSREADADKARLAAVLDNTAEGVVIIDPQGEIREVNEAAARIFGWTRTQLIGRPVTTLMDAARQPEHQGFIDRYLQTGVSDLLGVGPRRLPGRRRDGERVWIELSVGEAWVGGERCFIGACRDIGERIAQDEALRRANIALEETAFELKRVNGELEDQRRRVDALVRSAEAARRDAEEARYAKARFLAAVSHELRTPLNGVLAVADLLVAQALPKGASELVDIVQRSGRDLLALLNEVLDLSMVESGALALSEEPFSPEELFRCTAAIWAPAARAKGLELRVDLDDLPPAVLGDAGRLRQVLSNLINNAIKFTQRGHVRLAVSASRRQPGVTALTITVADTGPGFDAQVTARLFEPFVRARGDQAGAGLGLSICREIVGLMRGAIFAEANPGGGSRVIVEIELAEPQQAVVCGPAARAAALMLDPALSVLVAEDHPVNRQVMELLLDALGVRRRVVEDGLEAVAAAEGERFDVILMDIRMPRMDGLSAARAIRAGGGANAATPILAVTADAMPGDETAVLQAGVDAILPKPVTLEGLAAAMEALVTQAVPG